MSVFLCFILFDQLNLNISCKDCRLSFLVFLIIAFNLANKMFEIIINDTFPDSIWKCILKIR